MSALTMTLRDGRTFAFYEFGDPAGVPVIFTTGTPVSGTLGVEYHEAATTAGIRWISVDKPGYGLSTFDPIRSLSRYAEDVRELADHLGLDRFAAVGESGGGPHVLAIGRYLPERVTTIVTVSGLGPAHEAWVRKEMMPFNRRMFWLARTAPWLMGLSMAPLARAFRPGADEKKRATVLAKFLEQTAPEDRIVLDQHEQALPRLIDAIAGGYSQGAKAAVQEYRLFATPWEFRLEDITVPTHILHGTNDKNVPLAVAQHIAALIPHTTTQYIEGGGHLAGYNHRGDVMAVVLAASSVK